MITSQRCESWNDKNLSIQDHNPNLFTLTIKKNYATAKDCYKYNKWKKRKEKEYSLTGVVLRFSAFYGPTNRHARLGRETEIREELGPRRALVYPAAKHKYFTQLGSRNSRASKQ